MHKLRSLCWSLLGHLGLISFIVLSLSPSGVAAPVVRITKPQSGQMVAGQTWIEVAYRAKDNNPIQAVQLYVDHQLSHHWRLPVPKLDGTQSFSWNFSFAGGTTHTVTAKAIDTEGGEGTAEIIVSVRSISSEQPDQIPPVVNVYYPAQGAQVEGEIELKANATDNVGVKAVFFYVDGKLHTMIMNAPPYVAKWDTTKATDGPHLIKASAWDEQENRGDSAEVTVLVDNRAGTTAQVATATAAETAEAGQGQVPAVVTGPIADAAPMVQQPAADTGVVEQTFGDLATVARPAAPEPSNAGQARIVTVPESQQQISGARLGQPAKALTVTAPVTRESISTAVPVSPAATVGKATLVRLPSATTTKATGEAVLPKTGPEPAPARYAMAAGSRSTAPATSTVSSPPAMVMVAQSSKPAAGLAPVPSSLALLPAGEYSGALNNRMALPPASISQQIRDSAATSVKPPQLQETVEYQVAMLPRPEEGILPHAERVSKPATGVSLPKEIGELRDIAVVYDGKMLDLRAAPEIHANISVGPLREIFEQTNGVLYWFAQQKKVRAVSKELDISLQIGNPLVTVNDQEQELILAPYIKCGRTMVPLQFLADTLDVAIRYNPATGQLVISSTEF